MLSRGKFSTSRLIKSLSFQLHFLDIAVAALLTGAAAEAIVQYLKIIWLWSIGLIEPKAFTLFNKHNAPCAQYIVGSWSGLSAKFSPIVRLDLKAEALWIM